MHQVSNAEAVTSGVASLILFSTTLFAGYALAEVGNGAPGLALTSATATQPTGTAADATSARDESRNGSLRDRLKPTPAQVPLRIPFDLR